MMTRGVIEAMFVGHDSDVRQVAEEDQGAKLILFFGSRSGEASPEACGRCRVQNRSLPIGTCSKQIRNNRRLKVR